MSVSESIKDQVCVIIPTYNNCTTLAGVIRDVLEYSEHIIVVNDGSTDTTAELLKDFKQQIKVFSIPQNKGKGNALSVGFKQALKLGYSYAISIDSDGQHFASDIPNFITALENSKDKKLLLIGGRNMGHKDVPKKSSFGNKFSNFWFWVETGVSLEDTQSGYRLYPLREIAKLNLYTTKFEFEIEVIVKADWNGVTVKNIPVKVFYDPENRISHFRPFRDFARISILNTYLVILKLFYIGPRDLINRLRAKGLKRFLREDFLHSSDSPRKKALSMALGVFIGISPFWGFQTVLVILLSIFFKLNKVIAFTCSNISLPPMIPFIVLISLYIGNRLLGYPTSYTMDDFSSKFEMIEHIEAYIIGSFTLATVASIVIGVAGYLCFLVGNKKKIILNDR